MNNNIQVVAICETCNQIGVCVPTGDSFTCEECLGVTDCENCGEAFIPETSGFFQQDELCGPCFATIQDYGYMGEDL